MDFKIEVGDWTAWVTHVTDTLKEAFPDRNITIVSRYHTRQKSRFIQLTSAYPNKLVHYEYSDGWIYFHMEEHKLKDSLLKFIRTNTKIRNLHEELGWENTSNGVINGSCWLKHCPIHTLDDLVSAFQRIASLFDPLLVEAAKRYSNQSQNAPYQFPDGFQFQPLSQISTDESVLCLKCSLRQLFRANLVVPDYQRDYCWGKQEIKALVQSLREIQGKEPYHLGTVILHEKEGRYSIIDGQQRLTTLTLYLRELGFPGEDNKQDSLPLLKQKYLSRQSVEHVAYAKYLLHSLLQRINIDPAAYAQRLADQITFSVLILKEDNLDLAYTFFSNQNSKGVPLSDFDLLKAHHLRYIFNDAQAEHLAAGWNELVSEETSSHSVNSLQRTLGAHLFRLRHWLRDNPSDESVPRRVQKEYVAAPIMRSIPPFGEQFVYHDKIQGGSHFFAYADHFVSLYRDFLQTPQVSLLRQYLGGSRHDRYADVIETLLFAYYLKFHCQYLSEALFCISSVLADHRYSNSRALPDQIKEHARRSELVMMIEQASSPTFFLAESLNSVRYSGLDLEEADIKNDFYNRLRNIFAHLSDVKDVDIQQRINDEYLL